MHPRYQPRETARTQRCLTASSFRRGSEVIQSFSPWRATSDRIAVGLLRSTDLDLYSAIPDLEADPCGDCVPTWSLARPRDGASPLPDPIDSPIGPVTSRLPVCCMGTWLQSGTGGTPRVRIDRAERGGLHSEFPCFPDTQRGLWPLRPHPHQRLRPGFFGAAVACGPIRNTRCLLVKSPGRRPQPLSLRKVRARFRFRSICFERSSTGSSTSSRDRKSRIARSSTASSSSPGRSSRGRSTHLPHTGINRHRL